MVPASDARADTGTDTGVDTGADPPAEYALPTRSGSPIRWHSAADTEMPDRLED